MMCNNLNTLFPLQKHHGQNINNSFWHSKKEATVPLIVNKSREKTNNVFVCLSILSDFCTPSAALSQP